MKLLVVDDNKYVVEGLKAQLNWSALGIQSVIGVYSVKQAKAVIENEKPDFLISDIEMPGENAFDLLEWIEKNGYNIVTVLLTSYSSFNYARQAVRYHCADYLLKPISTPDLEEVFMDLIEERLQKDASRQLVQYGNNWLSHLSIVKDMFWRDLLLDGLLEDKNEIMRRIQEDKLSYTDRDRFVIALFTMEFENEGSRLNANLMRFSAENVISELMENTGHAVESIFYNGKSRLLLIFKTDDYYGQRQIGSLSGAFADVFSRLCHAAVHGYISADDTIDRLTEHVQTLESISLEKLNNEEEITLEQDYHEEYGDNALAPQFEEWEILLKTGKEDQFRIALHDYFEELRKDATVSRKRLIALLADWDAIVVHLLRENNITTYQFLTLDRDAELAEKALTSLTAAEELLRREGSIVVERIKYVRKEGSFISDVQEYIRAHLDNVSRSSISEAFFISPNYLSKVYKKETGVLLSEFIQQERMKEAKNLLLSSTMNISSIATETGYPSFAHFSKQFKKIVGISPNEFRKQNASASDR